MISKPILIFVLIPLVYGSVSVQTGRCVMFSLCGEFEGQTCKVDRLPVPLESENVASKLKEYCPELIAKYEDDLCCDAHQIGDLTKNLGFLQSLIGHCPSCYTNIRKSFCEFTCSPNQSKFLNVTEVAPTSEWALEDDPDLPPEVVRTVDFFITKKYIEGTFESCKNVVIEPQSNETAYPAMDLLCGPWGSLNCTGERWFGFMGSTENGHSPFDINYRIIDTQVISSELRGPFQALDLPIYSCGEAPPGSTERCACIDCPVSCLVPQQSSSDSSARLDLWLSSILFILFSFQ